MKSAIVGPEIISSFFHMIRYYPIAYSPLLKGRNLARYLGVVEFEILKVLGVLSK